MAGGAEADKLLRRLPNAAVNPEEWRWMRPLKVQTRGRMGEDP